jgi:hypothetical protein
VHMLIEFNWHLALNELVSANVELHCVRTIYGSMLTTPRWGIMCLDPLQKKNNLEKRTCRSKLAGIVPMSKSDGVLKKKT